MTLGTVITTVFNGCDFVERYGSVIAASVHASVNLQWILLDDGSTDDTTALVKAEIATLGLASRVRVVSPGRLGRARALNEAVNHVETPLFFVHDFDDISYPDRFSVQAARLNSDARLGCVGGGYEHVNADSGSREVRSMQFDAAVLAARFPLYVPFPHTFMAFRTSAVRAVGGYPNWDDYEEMGLLARLIDSGWLIDAVPQVLGEHFIYKRSYFERQFGFTRRRWRNLKRQLAMRREFACIRVSRSMILARFAYNFIPDRAKAVIRRISGYAT